MRTGEQIITLWHSLVEQLGILLLEVGSYINEISESQAKLLKFEF